MPPSARPVTFNASQLPAGIASFFNHFQHGDRLGVSPVSIGDTAGGGHRTCPSGHLAANESAREASADQTAVSERSHFQVPAGSFISRSTGFPTKEWYPATSGLVFSRRECVLDMNLEEWGLFHPGLPEPSMRSRTGIAMEGCGEWIRTGGCEDRTHPVKVVRHSCKRLLCPKCGFDYIADKSRDAAERFDLYKQAKLAKNARLLPGEMRDIDPRQIIFTISPAKRDEMIQKVLRKTGGWFDHALFLDIFRKEFDVCLKVSGLIGGMNVYHDCRVRHPETGATGDDAKMLVAREAKLAGVMKPNDPDWKIYEYINTRKNWKEYYYFSPHLHTIVFGKIIDKNEFDRAFPGWTYHNKNDVTTVGGLVYYLLTHMAVIPGRNAIIERDVQIPSIPGRRSITWWGRMSSRSLGKDLEKEYFEPVVCECCGKSLVIRDAVDTTSIGQVMTRQVKIYTGFFRADREKIKPPGG